MSSDLRRRMTPSRPAGRPELPLTGRGPLVELARELRELRYRADLTYRELAERVHYSPAALSRAAAGERKPSWSLVRSVVLELDGDLDKFQELWERIDSPDQEGPDHSPTVPVQRSTPDMAVPPQHDRPPPIPVPEQQPRVRHRARHRPAMRWALLVLVGVLGAAAGFAAGHLTEARGSFLSTPTASIVSPAATTVPQTVPLYGTYADLPPGTLVWAATQDPVKNRYFPQDKPCVTAGDGTFTCGTYYVGKQDAPDRSTYRLFVLSADSNAVTSFIKYQLGKGGPLGADPGLESLPAGAEVLAAKTVSRL